MANNPAPGERDSLALAFANTQRRGPRGVLDAIETSQALGEFLAAHTVRAPEISPGALERSHALRDAIRELFYAATRGQTPAPATVAAVNERAGAAPRAIALEWRTGGAPRRIAVATASDPFTGALGEIASDAIELLTDERRERLVACAGPNCLRFLLRDHPRRHWCSKGCGERARSARYYRRHKGAVGGAVDVR